jgi:hypothetical protein
MPITFPNVFVLEILCLGNFAIYRIYWGVILVKFNQTYLFYDNDLPKGLSDKIDNHPLKKAAGGFLLNVIPGLLWIFCTIAIGWVWSQGF